VFRLTLKALEHLHSQVTASFMPEKCRIFKLAVLLHVYATANTLKDALDHRVSGMAVKTYAASGH
jgi:hypothetical protein